MRLDYFFHFANKRLKNNWNTFNRNLIVITIQVILEPLMTQKSTASKSRSRSERDEPSMMMPAADWSDSGDEEAGAAGGPVTEDISDTHINQLIIITQVGGMGDNL